MKCPKCGDKKIYRLDNPFIIGYICKRCKYYWNRLKRKKTSSHTRKEVKEEMKAKKKEVKILTNRWKMEKVIEEFLRHLVQHWDKNGCVKYPNGIEVKYIGLPAISHDLMEHIIAKTK